MLARDAMDVLALVDEHGRYGRRNRVVLISRRWDQVCGIAMSALTGPTRWDPQATVA